MTPWCIYPTANRDRGRETALAWHAMGYRVAVMLDGQTEPMRLGWADLALGISDYPGFPACINALAREVFARDPDTPCFVCGSDDILPDQTKRADVLAGEFVQHFGGTLGVMNATGDKYGGWRDCLLSAWVGREYSERINGGMGYLWPEYFHYCSDSEAYSVSVLRGLLWRREDVAEHYAHWTRTGVDTLPKPKREKVESMWPRDGWLFKLREKHGFPGSGLK